MSLSVEKILVKQVKIEDDNKELNKLIELIKKSALHEDPRKLLPSYSWYTVDFVLNNTYAAFANAIRRTLISELPVKCLTFDEADLKTNDDFILSDVVMKNINLVPIMQNYEGKNTISINVQNKTNDIIDVLSNDIKVNGANLVLDPNIVIIRLRPGKSLQINKLTIIEGYSKDNAAKFSLLDNVKYLPIDDNIEPFDSFTGQGTRSIEYDPKKFSLSFTTTGNISPRDVITKCANVLTNKLNLAKSKLLDYDKDEQNKKQYNAFGIEVSIIEDIHIYKFIGEYITLAYLLAQQCYILDNNVDYCAPAIDRYDNEIAIVKLKHASSTKLLLSAIDAILKDVNAFHAAFEAEFKKHKM